MSGNDRLKFDITVLTTVHNGMPFIAEAIESVRAQRYSQFRHCVIDDGSTDNTADFLDRESDRGISVIHVERIGRGRALNLGLEHCSTDFLAILDADDVASPAWLSEMVAIMKSNRDIDVLSCSGMLDRSEIEVKVNEKISAYKLTPATLLYRNPVHHSGTLIRAQSLREVGGYDESRDCLFDYELWVRFMKGGKEVWRVDNGFIFKRIHPRQHFERKKRLHFLLEGYRIRKRVSQDLLGGRGSLIPAILFMYGLLPRIFRHWIYKRGIG
jgi:glycosyltransferase involved in cell wall biosynthesis